MDGMTPTPVIHLTIEDLLTRWGGSVNRGTLANWRAKGGGPRFIKLGRSVLYPLNEVEAFEQDRLRCAVHVAAKDV